MPGFGEALGSAVEAGQVIANTAVEGLHPMRLGLGDDVWLWHAVVLECLLIAGVGIGADGRDVGASLLDLGI